VQHVTDAKGKAVLDRKCPSEEMLAAFVRGELDEAREDEIAEHSNECSVCDAKLAEIERQLWQLPAVTGSPWGMQDFSSEVEFERAAARLRNIGRDSSEQDACSRTTDFLSAGTEQQRPGGTSLVSDNAPHRSIRYHVLRDHAEGGLGKVSVATDVELNREVAFKEIKPRYAHDPYCRQRFASEAEITGNLEHPGIVPVYGFGELADGRMYYAMRFVRGSSLKDHIRDFHALVEPNKFQTEAFRKLLGHFAAMCYAVAYANSRKVLHRDLKPANVMLGEYGETLVVDWGLAKPVEGDDSTTSTSSKPPRIIPRSGSVATQAGSVVGIAGYMSPEQAQGEIDSLGVASDVFSLGATLYHLLVGSAPFVGESAIERTKGAEVVPPRQQLPCIPKPLQAICLRAMKPLPGDRYPSAKALAADVERWLNDLAVEAYRESYVELLGRWTRKHFQQVMTVGGLLVLLVAVSTVAAFLVRQSEQRAVTYKHEAVQRAGQTRQVVDVFLGATSSLLEYYPSAQQARIKLLERAARDYEALATGRSSDPELEVERGRVLLALGRIRLRLNDSEQAATAFTHAESVFAKVVETDTRVVSAQTGLADTWISLASVRWESGLSKEPLELLQRAIEKLESLKGDQADGDSAKHLVTDSLGIAYMNQGELLETVGESDNAQRSLAKAKSIFKTLVTNNPGEPRYRDRLATVHRLYGRNALGIGDLQAATQRFDEALQVLNELVTQTPGEPVYVESLAGALVESADLHRRLGRYENQRLAYETANSLYDELLAALPDSPVIEEARAMTLVDLGRAEHLQCHCQRAIARLQESIATFEAVEERDVWQWEQLAAAQDFLGQVLVDAGTSQAAKDHFQKAMAIFEALVVGGEETAAPVLRLRHAVCQRNIAALLATTDRDPAALQHIEASLQTVRQLAAEFPQHPNYRAELAITLAKAAAILNAVDPSELAAKHREEAIETWRTVLQRSPEPDYYFQAARFLVTISTTEKAEALQAVEWASEAVRAVPDNALYLTTLGAAQLRHDDAELALQSLARVPIEFGEAGFWRSMAWIEQDRVEEARQALDVARLWREEKLPGNRRVRALQREVEQRLEDAELR
jgi:serine/threonine-protein kinase